MFMIELSKCRWTTQNIDPTHIYPNPSMEVADGPVLVSMMNDQNYFVHDGRHRCIRALLRGEELIEAEWLEDFDADRAAAKIKEALKDHPFMQPVEAPEHLVNEYKQRVDRVVMHNPPEMERGHCRNNDRHEEHTYIQMGMTKPKLCDGKPITPLDLVNMSGRPATPLYDTPADVNTIRRNLGFPPFGSRASSDAVGGNDSSTHSFETPPQLDVNAAGQYVYHTGPTKRGTHIFHHRPQSGSSPYDAIVLGDGAVYQKVEWFAQCGRTHRHEPHYCGEHMEDHCDGIPYRRVKW